MYKKGNLLRTHQRVLTVSLLLTTLFACRKVDVVPPENIAASELSNAISATKSNNLLYHENCDLTSFFSTYASKQTSTSYGITASTKQFYNGIKSARFEIRDTDPEVKNGTRAEISFPEATNMNRWYSYALFVPAAQYKYDEQDEVISQWHQGGGKTPALCLRTKADHIYLRIMGSTWIDLGLIDKDKWHAYVMHVKHSSKSDGLIEIWRDGKKIVNRTGTNMYDISSGTYHAPNWKLGVYKSDWNGSKTTATNLRVLYFDDIKMGNEYASYDEMVPVPNSIISPSTPTSPIAGTRIVTGLTLVDAATERDVITITNGQIINLAGLGVEKVNIRANTFPSILGSVKFELSGQQSKTYVDNKAPYALHGDDGNGNYYFGNWNPPATGTYTLKATPYSGDDETGTAGISQTITFTIVNDRNDIASFPSGTRIVTGFTLVDAATERDVVTITNGQTISLSALGVEKANIRANTFPSILGSVKFELNGQQSKTYIDNKAPYALHGDNENGNYYYGDWNPPALGTYTLKATPYSGDDETGTSGVSNTITFTIKK